MSCCRRIYGHLRNEMIPEAGRTVHDDSESISLVEKMSKLGAICDTDRPIADVDPSEAFQGEDDGEPDLDAALRLDFLDLRKFLLESPEYEWLLHSLNNSMSSDINETSRLRIRKTILESLHTCTVRPTESYTMSVQVHWQPREFLRQQYGHLPTHPLLGSVITLSGSGDEAYASTCQAYVQNMWPRSGPRVIDLIQAAVDSGSDIFRNEENDLSLQFHAESESVSLCISGDPLFLVEAAEVFIWVSSACRASSNEGLQKCRIELDKVSLNPGLLLVARTLFEDVAMEDVPSDSSCWHAMFRNPVIVEGYPIPMRNSDERGLELSVELMLSLARTSWATVYNGALLLKGFATLLTPTLKTGKSVIWHLTVNSRGKRQSYNEGLRHSCLRNIDEALFPGARHFVGWLRSANYLVGKSTRDFGDEEIGLKPRCHFPQA